jgi:hypothetical protein
MRVEDPKGNSVNFEYDENKRLVRASNEHDRHVHVNECAYENNRLASVSHNTTTDEPDVFFSHTYDALGNIVETKVGEQILSQNVYSDTPDRKLERVEYGNGGKVHYAYDEYKRIESVKYDEDTQPAVEYTYGYNGKVTKLRDNTINCVEEGEYDGAERLAIHRLSDDSGDSPAPLAQYNLTYDGCNRAAKITETLPGGSYETSFTYANDDAVTNA